MLIIGTAAATGRAFRGKRDVSARLASEQRGGLRPLLKTVEKWLRSMREKAVNTRIRCNILSKQWTCGQNMVSDVSTNLCAFG